jgi:CDP-diacylglycerol---serine O-phosphatidyltransferase
MIFKKSIPNILTSLNLLSGCIAIVFVFEDMLHVSAFLVIIASVFDFLDGFSARLLNAYSKIGKELDSLADLISFGLAPATIVYSLMQHSAPEYLGSVYGMNILPFTAFLLTILSGVRLAVFNVDERQSEQFIGLPTPANAIFFISLPLLLFYGSENDLLYNFFLHITSNFYILLILTTVFSFLLVSNLPLFSLKFKNLSFKTNLIRYVFVFLSITLMIFLKFYALPFIILIYILLSVTTFLWPLKITYK